jgi:phage baseplate assembly protein gpV
MSRNKVVHSPNGQYSLHMSPNEGHLILYRGNVVVWRVNSQGVAEKCFMQPDGNLVLKSADNKVIWTSHTSGNAGAELRLDDGGQVFIVLEEGTPLWLAGMPQGQYDSDIDSSHVISLLFPIRAAFYYPWYPETWTVNGKPVRYTPTLGRYQSGRATVQRAHVDMLEYANVEVSIASWWGPDTHLDRARLTNLLNLSKGKSLTWTIYHEEERHKNQTIQELQQDLDYLKKWFAWHENWAHVDGLPLLFVYNEGNCDVSRRWMAAANGEWYVVLKTFRNHDDCPVQPNHWHEYGPATAVVHKPGYSFSISPGFWRATEASPILARLSMEEWRANVMGMVSSKEPWQLITTFNEWGEGTAVEGCTEWGSSSGYGHYVDVLHSIQ